MCFSQMKYSHFWCCVYSNNFFGLCFVCVCARDCARAHMRVCVRVCVCVYAMTEIVEDNNYTPARQWLTREELVLFDPSRAGSEPSGIHMHIYVLCLYMHIYTYTYKYAHVPPHVHVHMHICMYRYEYVCKYV